MPLGHTYSSQDAGRSAHQSSVVLSGQTLQSTNSLEKHAHYYASFGVQQPDLREMAEKVSEAGRLAAQGYGGHHVQFKYSSQHTSGMSQEPIPP